MFTLCCGASVRLTKADGTEAGAKRSQEKLFFLGEHWLAGRVLVSEL